MSIEITWTITALIAVSSFLSPIAVAIINNRHHTKIRAIELEHDERLKQIDLHQQALIRQADIYYADKKTAFSAFAKASGAFSLSKQTAQTYETLHASIDTALLFCNPENQKLLIDFQNYVDAQVFGSEYSIHSRAEYSKALNKISLSLNKELESTKPIIDCKSGK